MGDQKSAGAPSTPAGRRVRSAARGELYAFLELAALCGLAVAQPLLDAIGRSPDFLLFHHAGAAEALALAAIVVLVPPLALWALGVPARLAGPRAQRLTQAVLVGSVTAVLAVQVGKHVLPLRGLPLAVLAGLVGAGAALAYARLAVFGQILRVAAAGPLVFVTLFAFASPASAVVLGAASGDATAAAAGRSVGAHPPVVVIVLDEFPLVSLLDSTGGVDAARMPNFARLAAGSTWYRNATAVSPHTTYAVPAMLSGRFPAGESAPHYSRYPKNLFTLLGGVYDIQAWETVTELCPPRYCARRSGTGGDGLPVMVRESASLLRQVVSPYDSGRDPTAGFQESTVTEESSLGEESPAEGPDLRMDRLAENQPARFREFLAALPAGTAPAAAGSPPAPGSSPVVGSWPAAGSSPIAGATPAAGSSPIAGSTPAAGASPAVGASPAASGTGQDGRPVLRFLHMLIPHSPWLYLSSGLRYDGPPDLPFDGQWWARLAYQRHMQQVAYTDRLLGEALAALDRAGLYDRSLIVVTSDHGDSFSEGVAGRDLDGAQRAAAELAWVPLFIKEPGQQTGRVDDRNWQEVDLLPTLADYTGVSLPWRTDGISALRQRREGEDKRFDQVPGVPLAIKASAHFPAVLRGPAARPVLPDVPEFALVGRQVSDLPGGAAGPPVKVANGREFADVRPQRGKVPALVDATFPAGAARPPAGTPVAIAVNGRIGAVALAAADHDGDLRAVGLVTDERLFVTGANDLQLYVVSGSAGQWRLEHCRPVG